MQRALINWAARTAVTEGHPLRWLGKPILRAWVGAIELWLTLTTK